MGKRKYLSGLEIMQRGLDMRWLNWYIRRGRVSLPYNMDAVSRKELRKISWRRVF
jgi:hypothetical protein